MLVATLGFLAIALLAAVIGWHGFATGLAVLACLSFLFVFFSGTGMVLWQLLAGKRSAPPI